jgi:hypothetical protein
MSQLSKSLEKRIQELTASIESQKTELAAYERVLDMENSKENDAEGSSSIVHQPVTVVSRQGHAEHAGPAKKASELEYTGNKTTLVAEIVKSYGSAGATPKDVDAFFTAKDIERSKNLIYNTLSYLVAQKKLHRRDGKYFVVGGAMPAKKSGAAKKTAAPTKRRLSPEGLKRIKEALKKRWAAKRAAEAAAGKPSKKATKKA